MGLENKRLELKVNGTAAPQGNHTGYTGDDGREGKVKIMFFLWFDTKGQMDAWLVVGKNRKRQEIPQADGRSQTVHTHTHTHTLTHTHTHTHTHRERHTHTHTHL